MRTAASLLGLFSLMSGLSGCNTKGNLPVDVPLPDTCSKDGVAAVGNVRLQLVGPGGAQDDTQDCRQAMGMITFPVTGIEQDKTTPGKVHYNFQVSLPPFQPAAQTQWVVIPPPVVTSEGLVTEFDYDPMQPDRYLLVRQTGVVGSTLDAKTGKSVPPVLKLSVDGPADVTPPVMTRIDAGMGLVEQGGTQAISASFQDDGSGLRMSPVPVAQLSLLLPSGALLPLWTLTQPTQTVSAVIPGVLPPGNYPVYAQAADVVGNSARWQAQPGLPPDRARYQRLQQSLCPLVNNTPGPMDTSLPLVTLVVGSLMTADQQPPQLVSLSAALASGGSEITPTVKPCQEIVLRMGLSDNRPLPPMQQGMIAVLPLDPRAQSRGLTQVPAFPQGNPGVLEAHYVVPADAVSGPWIFLPAYAVDAANNAIVGSYVPPPDGKGMGTISLQNPITGSSQIAPVPPGQFVVQGEAVGPAPKDGGMGAVDGGAPAAAPGAQLLELAVAPGTATHVQAGGPVQIQASYLQSGKLPTLPVH